jgi:hypothetical protein
VASFVAAFLDAEQRLLRDMLFEQPLRGMSWMQLEKA